jgi:hypothetical protein
MGLNPMARPWAEELSRYGSFLKEKNKRIESSPWMTPNQVVHGGLKVALRKFNGDESGSRHCHWLARPLISMPATR